MRDGFEIMRNVHSLEPPVFEEGPIYQIAFQLYDNGITRDLVMDYGDFSMTGKLVDLKVFDKAPECSPK